MQVEWILCNGMYVSNLWNLFATAWEPLKSELGRFTCWRLCNGGTSEICQCVALAGEHVFQYVWNQTKHQFYLHRVLASEKLVFKLGIGKLKPTPIQRTIVSWTFLFHCDTRAADQRGSNSYPKQGHYSRLIREVDNDGRLPWYPAGWERSGPGRNWKAMSEKGSTRAKSISIWLVSLNRCWTANRFTLIACYSEIEGERFLLSLQETPRPSRL